jgi:hypothetical protein
MTTEDELAETDLFLDRSGPPTVDFPFHRDNYYMLEAYLPNRAWNGEDQRWMYMPADQHDRDIAYLLKWTLETELKHQQPPQTVIAMERSEEIA